MAVDSKPGSTNGVNGAATNGAALKNRGKRHSQLQAAASSLPTVEHSLEEFIAKANQTLVDVSTWGNAETEAKEQDAQRREIDAQRWKAAEGQLREGEARESSLRRQLDGLQGKLAEAEARAAVAGTTVGSAAHDSTIAELKTKIEQAERDRRLFEEQKQALSQQLMTAKQEAATARTSAAEIARTSSPAIGINDGEAEERVRLAEAKAAKAIAAARAAQAGLTVSSADLAAIESGLVVLAPPAKSTPWVAILVAFLGGLAIMFAVWKFVLNKDTAETKPTQPAAVETQPAATPTPAPAPAKPIVTPIEETPTPVETKPAAVEPAPAAVETKPAAVETKPAAVETKPAAVETTPAAVDTKPAKATPAKATKAPAKAPAKRPAKADKKPAGGIVDPF